MSLTIESNGRRHYILGNTFPLKGALKDGGAKWDADRRAWWVGSRDKADALVASLSTPAAAPAAPSSTTTQAAPNGDGLATKVAGRANYKGSSCFVVGRVERGRTQWDDRIEPVTSRDGKVLLTSRDGSRQWWAPRSEVEMTKSYDKPQTIGGLAKFAASVKSGSIRRCHMCGSTSCESLRGGLCDDD
jgi:hypothetical protein